MQAGRGADSAFHTFEGPGEGAAIITQALNGVRRRPPLPRHSISDLGPHSLNRIASIEAPVAPILECVLSISTSVFPFISLHIVFERRWAFVLSLHAYVIASGD